MKRDVDPSTLTPDQLIERWTEWMEFTKNEALELYRQRFLLENVHQMFQTNEELRTKGVHVGDWLLDMYKTQSLITKR